MTTAEFKRKLADAGLNNTSFAALTGMNPKTITNWNAPDKSPPRWVQNFLDFYIKAKKYDELIQVRNWHRQF